MPEQQKPGEAKKRALPKGRHRSAIKRQRQNLKRRLRNLRVRSHLKSAIKKVRAAVSGKNKTDVQEAFKMAISLLDRAASKGVIHRRNASRRISRLSTLVQKLAA